MKRATKQLILNFYSEFDNNTELKEVFEETLVKFVEFHNFQKKGQYDTLFCNIHNNFQSGHNCVACNLNYSNRRIENFLFGYKLFNDINTTITNFIFLLYLQAECIFEYINIIQIPENYVQKNFQILFTVKRWANFLKHPKSFLLVHHPIWDFKKEENVFINKNKPIIDTEFVKKFYAGDSKNKELLKLLSNKEDLTVLFPNPIELIEEFCQAQKRFSDLISKNQFVRDVLNDKATIIKFYDSDSDSEDKE